MKTEYLLREQVGHVLAALTPTNRLVAEVCLHTGLRVGDVIALRPEEIGRCFWVTEAKTGKRRKVGLTDDLVRKLVENSHYGWCFPGRKPGTHVTRQAVWADVKRAARAFRLPQNVAPHSFRKVYAVDLLDKYGDIERVRRALNHGGMATTMIYAMADKLLTAKGRRRRAR